MGQDEQIAEFERATALMLGMEMHNLADIYLLLKSCHFSNLERIFVQVTFSCGFLYRFA